LPYQPLNELAASLSAADMHLVVMGDPFKGLVHPCKIYNILTIGKPFLYIGPAESHITDIAAGIQNPGYVRIVRHADVEAVVAHIRERAILSEHNAQEGAKSLAGSFSMEALLPRMIKLVESLNATNALCDPDASQPIS